VTFLFRTEAKQSQTDPKNFPWQLNFFYTQQNFSVLVSVYPKLQNAKQNKKLISKNFVSIISH
jgi:hypothetical protein